MTAEPRAFRAAFEYVEAYPIALLGSPVSAAATNLVEHLLDQLIVADAISNRPTSILKARQALGALLADLLDLQRGHADDRRPLAGAHGLSPGDFAAGVLGFGRNIFVQVITALEAAGRLQRRTGAPRWRKAFDQIHNFNGQVTTFRLTHDMVELAASFGVGVDAWQDHWRSSGGKPVALSDKPKLVLRGKKVRVNGKKQNAPDLPINERSAYVQDLLTGVEKLNRFLVQQNIGGITFPGLRRIFSNGDQPEFEWNKGGRYYSLPGGHRYETMSAERRLERITLNGERVGEADIRASHLTLLHALLNRPFDPKDDPYVVAGLGDRTIVKWWCTQALGSSTPKPRRWPSDKKELYGTLKPGRQLQKDFPIAKVGAAVIARHPLLAELDTCGISTLDLQFHESEVLRMAMDQLMAAAVAVLPIHDGLIVAVSYLAAAQEAIVDVFHDYVGGVIGHPPPVRPEVIPKNPQALQPPSGTGRLSPS